MPTNAVNLFQSALALSPDQVARLNNQRYVASIRRPPQFVAGSTPYGVNKALASPDPANALQADPRFLQPGPSAEERPQPKPEQL